MIGVSLITIAVPINHAFFFVGCLNLGFYGYELLGQIRTLLFWQELDLPETFQLVIQESFLKKKTAFRQKKVSKKDQVNKILARYGIKLFLTKQYDYILIAKKSIETAGCLQITIEEDDLLGEVSVLWHHHVRIAQVSKTKLIVFEDYQESYPHRESTPKRVVLHDDPYMSYVGGYKQTQVHDFEQPSI